MSAANWITHKHNGLYCDEAIKFKKKKEKKKTQDNLPRFSRLNVVCHHAAAHHNHRIQRRRRRAVIKLDFTCKLTLTGEKPETENGLVSMVCHGATDYEMIVPRLVRRGAASSTARFYLKIQRKILCLSCSCLFLGVRTACLKGKH